MIDFLVHDKMIQTTDGFTALLWNAKAKINQWFEIRPLEVRCNMAVDLVLAISAMGRVEKVNYDVNKNQKWYSRMYENTLIVCISEATSN